MKQEMYKILEELTERVENLESEESPMNRESWQHQLGVLMTGNDAKNILEHIKSLSEDNIQLVKANDVISKMNAENRRQKEYLSEFNSEAVNMLNECLNQLEYLQDKFTPTGTTNSLISRLSALVTKYYQ